MIVRHLVLTDEFAGVERHVAILANEQVVRGHQVEVWAGAPVMESGSLDPRVRWVPAIDLTHAALGGLRGPTPDIVHAHMTRAELAGVPTRVFRGAPLVVTRHFAAIRGSSPLGHLARPVLGCVIDAQIAISEYVAAAADGQSTVIYPGVPSETATLDTSRNVILVVQRLEREKATDVALRAFAEGAPPSWRMEVLGEGAERKRLETLAEALQIAERVCFLGFRSDVDARMQGASILLAPCPIEGLGLSVLEAMARSLPVIASGSGAHLETVGRAASPYLFSAGNWGQAAELIADLCSSPDLRESYGARLRGVQSTLFTPARQAQHTDHVYEKVCR